MWQKAEVRTGTVRYGKHQRTRNSNKAMPEASKKRGNVLRTRKNEAWLWEGVCNAHKGDLEMPIIHSRRKRKLITFLQGENIYFSLEKISKVKLDCIKEREKRIKRDAFRKRWQRHWATRLWFRLVSCLCLFPAVEHVPGKEPATLGIRDRTMRGPSGHPLTPKKGLPASK